ncbi:MAG TPA: hypothetical protein VGO09_10095, partial [Flavisolibacter sp.]|nr:hypothetical protein [Flavisolibacter sp.]
RLEIKAQKDSVLNFSKNKPYSRKEFISHIGRMDSSFYSSKVDRYNYYSLMVNNLEWATGDRTEYQSKKPIGKHFYLTPANLFEVHTPDLFLAINPVVQFMAGKESNNKEQLFLNSRGVSIRGRIANKIGFYTFLADNQERDPLYVQRYVNSYSAVPSAGYYKDFKGTGYDYFDARGYITFNAAKYIDVVFGYDKNFIGNGYRSLFLSDFSNNALFLKLNTRIWKFNYENLFMELTATEPRGGDRLLGKKYATLHHLDLAITKWLNIGVFEGVIFARKDHFDFSYLNPIIFYRSVEQQNGSPDNSLAGFDAKANIAHHFQLYGQLLLDEFKLSEIRANNGWWGNKFGIQLGGKYIDAFGISNLDLQVEMNRVRPFTYSHDDSLSNYSHYNQPLAHPLGANFQEVIGIARYQPAPKWTIEAKAIYYFQGKDSGNSDYGGNIFLLDRPPYRTMDYGFKVGTGVKTKTIYGSLFLSYELKQNLFIEANAVYRKETALTGIVNPSETIFSAGIRWNMHRRKFEF